MDFIKLTNDVLNVGEISNVVSSASCGATSLFIGTTRDNFEDQKVAKLEYEAYIPMAEKSIKKICEDVRNKWKVEHIAVYHRLGVVAVKEASVVIAVSSAHRTEALEAVHYIIDTLKASVPIWKKEVYENEEATWKENKECPWKSHNVQKGNKENERTNADRPCSTETDSVAPDLVQIKATGNEIKRRIDAFIERKREEVNFSNIQDFCYQSGGPADDSESCARVNAVVMCRKDSKSHLRVRRVLNPWGPQTRGVDPGSMGETHPPDPAALEFSREANDDASEKKFVPHGIDERLQNIEKHLRIKEGAPVPKDIYARLKNLEDRILFLEGLSPEYVEFWTNMNVMSASKRKKTKETPKKQTYSVADLNSKIQRMICEKRD